MGWEKEKVVSFGGGKAEGRLSGSNIRQQSYPKLIFMAPIDKITSSDALVLNGGFAQNPLSRIDKAQVPEFEPFVAFPAVAVTLWS
ncbi:hypothetical protein BAR24_14905 [Gluconobacter oxydans]|nr:hypothetical protein BAR24_14905 [Gluconobacter oxydans]